MYGLLVKSLWPNALEALGPTHIPCDLLLDFKLVKAYWTLLTVYSFAQFLNFKSINQAIDQSKEDWTHILKRKVKCNSIKGAERTG